MKKRPDYSNIDVFDIVGGVKRESEFSKPKSHTFWIKYFASKMGETGMRYISSPKDSNIAKSLLKNFTEDDIKLMIDFIFDSDQTFVDKRTVGFWVLSKGWLNTIYNNSVLWKDGKFKKVQREYRSGTKADNKSTNEGKKSRIFF